MNLRNDLVASSFPHDWLTGRNESLITRARNEMTANFLKTDYEYMMFLDADIEFCTDDVGKLWNLQADIAVGFYPMKLPEKPLSAWVNGKLVRLEDCPQEPFEVDYAGTGFFMIKRNVVETLCETAESYEGPNGRVHALYMTPIHNDGFESEDYYFCRKASDAGFKIIGDPSIKLTHWGQYGYGS
jgi:hypothetical protein